MNVYVLLTEKKIHAYSDWRTARRVADRARRMGVEVEWLQNDVKRGNRYGKSNPIVETWPGLTPLFLADCAVSR